MLRPNRTDDLPEDLDPGTPDANDPNWKVWENPGSGALSWKKFKGNSAQQQQLQTPTNEWKTIHDDTTQLQAADYTVNPLSGPVVINNHTLQDNQSALIDDSAGNVDASNTITINFNANIEHIKNGVSEVDSSGTVVLDYTGVKVHIVRISNKFRVSYINKNNIDSYAQHSDAPLKRTYFIGNQLFVKLPDGNQAQLS